MDRHRHIKHGASLSYNRAAYEKKQTEKAKEARNAELRKSNTKHPRPSVKHRRNSRRNRRYTRKH